MAMYEPAYLPPNAEEQDFIQAYENVREKYKGGRVRSCYRDNSNRTSLSDCQARVFVFVFVPFICLTQRRWMLVPVCCAFKMCRLPCMFLERSSCMLHPLTAECFLLIAAHVGCHSSTLSPVCVCVRCKSASLHVANKQPALLTSDLDVSMKLYFKVPALCPLQPN